MSGSITKCHHSHCNVIRTIGYLFRHRLSINHNIANQCSHIAQSSSGRHHIRSLLPNRTRRHNHNRVVSSGLNTSNWIVFHSTEARLLLRSVMQWDPLKRPTIPVISMEPWMTGRKLHPGERLYREQVELMMHITLFAMNTLPL